MANIKDGATSLVATAPSPATSGTSLVVTSGEGSLFPAPPFSAILHPANSLPTVSVAERVTVTAVSTDTLTVTRGISPYSAKSVAAGWRISNAIFADDIIAGNTSFITKETPSGTVNGSNTTFTTSQSYVPGTLQVFVNGLAQSSYVTETTPSSGVFDIDAPLTGSNVSVSYQHIVTTSGNADTVDGYHANSTPTANNLLVLSASAKLPTGIVDKNSMDYTGFFNGETQTQYGNSSVTVVTAGVVASTTVTFPETFSGTPNVMVTSTSVSTTSIQTQFGVSGVSSSGFTINARHPSATGAVGFSWLATYTTVN